MNHWVRVGDTVTIALDEWEGGHDGFFDLYLVAPGVWRVIFGRHVKKRIYSLDEFGKVEVKTEEAW